MINCLSRYFLSPCLYLPLLTQIHIGPTSTPIQHSLCYLSTSVPTASLLIRVNDLLMLNMLCTSALHSVQTAGRGSAAEEMQA